MKNNVKVWLKLLAYWCLFTEYASGVDYYNGGDDYDDNLESSGCHEGWKANGDFCYKYFYFLPSPWYQAEILCRQQGLHGHLASLHTSDDVSFLYQMIYSTGHYINHDDHTHSTVGDNTVWVGLTKWCPNVNNLRWSDGSQFNKSLSPNMQAVASSQFKCGSYLVVPPSINVFAPKNCTEYKTFVCQLPRNGTKAQTDNRQLDETNACESYEWCSYGKRCYKVQQAKTTWQDAERICQSEGGNLLSVHSKDEERFATDQLIYGFSAGASFWTGLNKLETADASLRWSDKTPLDFYPQFVVDFNKYQYSSCVMYVTPRLYAIRYKHYLSGKMNSTWALTRCDEKRMSICSKYSTNYTGSSDNVTTYLKNGNCSEGWIRYGINNNPKCFKAYGVDNEADRANFIDAHRKCKQNGANLVSISSIYENYFVLSLLNSSSNSSWIGLYLKSSDQKIRWIDETALRYTNFQSSTLEAHGLEQRETDEVVPKSNMLFSAKDRCFFMSVSQSPGVWEPVLFNGDVEKQLQDRARHKRRATRTSSNYNFIRLSSLDFTHAIDFCHIRKLSFVCEKSVSTQEPLQKVNVLSCALNDNDTTHSSFKYGRNCYQFITVPKSWRDAENHCQKSNASLVSIMNIFEYGFLASMAKMIAMDQFWIGLSETKEIGQFEWSDEWPVHYTHWATNEPRSRSNAQCVKMRLKDYIAADWSTESCDNLAPFVCKTTSEEKPAKDQVEGSCEKGWLEGSTQCYKIVQEPMRAHDAVVECLREYGSGAMLATFPTKDDMDRVIKRKEFINAKKNFFIGLMQKPHGGYEWLTNHPLTFVNWAPEQPRYAWDIYRYVCVEMDHRGRWYDAGCYEVRYYICSKPKTIGTNATSTSEPITTTTAVLRTVTTTNGSSVSPIVTVSGAKHVTLTTTVLPVTNIELNRKSQESTAGSAKKLHASQAGSGTGVKVGIAFCVIFFMALFGGIAAFMYRKKRAGQNLFGDILGRGGNDQMRFEVLNEAE